MARTNPDPLRKLWLSRNYAQAALLLRSGAIPTASTLRHILSAKHLGPDLSSLTPSDSSAFYEAMTRLARTLVTALGENKSISAQMTHNGSLALLASTLCSRKTREASQVLCDDGSDPLAKALDAIFALAPSAAWRPKLLSSSSGKGNQPFLIKQTDLPLWTEAAHLSPQACSTLLAHASARVSIDPNLAWKTFLRAIKSWPAPATLVLLANISRAPDEQSFQRACTALAISYYSRAHKYDDCKATEYLVLLETMCTLHADMPGALCPKALLGSFSTSNSSHSLSIAGIGPYALLSPGTFKGAASHGAADDGRRARFFLDWLEGCSLIAAKLHMPDLDGLPLENKHLDNCYHSLRNELILASHNDNPLTKAVRAHAFPIGAPSLTQAFHSRKSQHELNQAVRELGPAPSSLRKTL